MQLDILDRQQVRNHMLLILKGYKIFRITRREKIWLRIHSVPCRVYPSLQWVHEASPS